MTKIETKRMGEDGKAEEFEIRKYEIPEKETEENT